MTASGDTMAHSVRRPCSAPAMASAVLGVAGLFTLWLGVGLLFSAVAAVTGHLGRHEVKKDRLRGRRLARLGLVTGYGGMLFFPVMWLGMLLSGPMWQQRQAKAMETALQQSEVKASRLFLACESYARANGQRYPGSWDALGGAYVTAAELRQLLKSAHRGGPERAYELVPHERPVLSAVSGTVIVIQEHAPPHVPSAVVVYANGEVKVVHNPDYTGP